MEWNKFSMSALRLIKQTEITSSVSSVDITDVFSADFDIYKITVDNVVQNSGSTASNVNLRFINSSGSLITSNYQYAYQQLRNDAAYAEVKSTSSSLFQQAISQVDDNLYNGVGVIYVFNPFNSSSYSFILNQAQGRSGSSKRGIKGIGVLPQTNSITGINISISGGSNITGGNIKIYGLRVDS